MTRAERLAALAERLFGPPDPLPPRRPNSPTEAIRRKFAAERKASGKLLTRPLSDADRRDWEAVVGWFCKPDQETQP